MWIRDPGWKKFGTGMEKSWIRNKHPGSATLSSSMFFHNSELKHVKFCLKNDPDKVQFELPDTDRKSPKLLGC
jgi:hypothetical protein